ncbi:MAG TPA: histidine kinase dimerization/phospho-acceptor domain-containing protein, partial [Acidimicrobiales bacterium]|nr:histidine kinase dimerization/phospho-acceptor domain-containing protein [Acidimicrobiales bacterium]
MAAPARTSTRRILAPAATRRVGRLKLLTAVLLTAALGVGLLVFGMIVAQADARYERARVDNLLERQVEAGREAVGVDGDGELDVELGQRPELAAGYPQLYVVAFAGEAGADPRVVFTPAAPTWPGVGVLDVARDAGATAAHATTTASAERRSSGDDQRLQLLAAPVLEADGEARAAVVGVANREHGEASHARLVSFMWWSAGAMLLFGIFVAVLLSRGRWWVADRVLLRHEQFLRDTAHELRAPVSRLRAVTEAGLSGAEPPERTLERVAAMVRGTDEVIEDLMTLSRLETGREPLCAEPA